MFYLRSYIKIQIIANFVSHSASSIIFKLILRMKYVKPSINRCVGEKMKLKPVKLCPDIVRTFALIIQEYPGKEIHKN